MAGPNTPRARARAQMLTEIKQRAVDQLARDGAGGLSLREVAREIGVVSSGIYRYFGSRDELLTALIVDAYSDLAARVATADQGEPATRYRRRWVAGCVAFRAWAVAEPHRFLLLYGSPVPGYAAPTTTVAPAGSVITALLQVVRDAAEAGVITTGEPPADDVLRDQLGQVAAGLELPLEPGSTVRAVRAFGEVVGLVGLELNGQFVGAFEPADRLFAEAAEQLADQLGLPVDPV